MPTTVASTNVEKRVMSAVPTWPVQQVPSPSVGDSIKVRTCSTADTQVPEKQPSKYSEAQKFLGNYHLLAESAMCNTHTLVGALISMAETYKMPTM
jgi:hypothetical protein